MKKAIICHGVSSGFDKELRADTPNCSRNWLGWLQQKYIQSGVVCQNPLFPNAWVPARNWADDVNMFSRLELDEDTRLVGHSCGAGFLLKYLSERPEIRVRHLVLVAPWIDPQRKLGDYFANLRLDKNLPERVGRIDLIYSENDREGVIESTEKILEALPLTNVMRLSKGHFNEEDMGREFPELWEVCKSEV
ncbi:MAG: alpha/beta hydrolase [Alphaproteobacteria bacterium]|nr:alpha/beta hydrolase [Alphaproteobacteria bacterium]